MPGRILFRCLEGLQSLRFGAGADYPEDALRLLEEQPDGSPAIVKALFEGWVLLRGSEEAWLYRVTHQREVRAGGRRRYLRLVADALLVYAEDKSTRNGFGKRPQLVLLMSAISAFLGREKGSDCLRLVVARSVFWELRSVSGDASELQAWSEAIASRLGHFRQARRQSQRYTRSALQKVMDVQPRRVRNRRLRRAVVRYFPCCEPCLGVHNAFSPNLTKKGSSTGLQFPAFLGSREGHTALVDDARLAEVSHPELQEAQGAHWSDQAVRYLSYCHRIPEELDRDFLLTLRMGVPDGLKRLVWPLAAGEAVVMPRTALGEFGVTGFREPAAFYDGVCQRAFGGLRPDRLHDPVPTFCQGIKGMDEAPPLRRVVRHLGLMTREGEEALRRLLWCMQLTCHSIEFCPFMPNLLATLLPYFDEAETMLLVSNIIRGAEAEVDPDNAANSRLMRTRQQLNKQAKLFVREANKKQIAHDAMVRLGELGVDVHAVAAELLQDGLAHCLNFHAFCRVVGSFLREGTEVILRYGLALLKLRSNDLIRCSTAAEAKEILAVLGREFSTVEKIDALTKVAFSFFIKDMNMARISTVWGSAYVAPREGFTQHMFCRPRLFEPRGHCPDGVWEVIWAWVPTWCRVLDPHLIYSPVTHGTSLRTCLEVCRKKEDSPMVFFVFTKEGDIIGGFSPTLWVRTSGYLKLTSLRRSPEEAFVFRQLRGRKQVEVFIWSGQNDMLMDASEVVGLIFGGDAAAIAINQDMIHASTSDCATFRSPMLVSPLPYIGSPACAPQEPPVLPSPLPYAFSPLSSCQDSSHAVVLDRESSISLCGVASADFEMLSFEVFALL